MEVNLLRTDYQLMFNVIEREIERYENRLRDIESMIKDAEYIYMTKETAWKYTEPIERKLKPLYRLREKLVKMS